uniref:Uncharacterized protein n=1 Tax=Acrobeloides nanus TaxID=290746 RepID=A0A914ECC4_9BILA
MLTTLGFDFRLKMFQFVVIFALLLQSFPIRIDAAPFLNEVTENPNAVKSQKESGDQKGVQIENEKVDIPDLDLSEFTDKELIELAKLLQNKIDAYDSRIPVEEYDMVLFPVELLNEEEEEPNNDHLLRTLVRDRRSPSSRVEDEPVPIIVIPDEEDSLPAQENEYLIVPEPGDLPLVPGAPDQAVILSEDELDELELRTKIADLSEILKERALRGL